MHIRSTVTGRVYEQADMIYIANPTQIAKYLKNGAVLYDLLVRSDDKILAAFSKAETRDLHKKWDDYQL